MDETKLNKGDFATTGTDSYEIKGQDPADSHVVLNISKEGSNVGVVLDRSGKRKKRTGNLLIDWYDSLNEYLISHSGVKVKAKSTFFHLLSVMLNSGIPMVKALESLYLQMEESPRLKRIIGEVASLVEEGASLSEAMLNYPSVFTEQEVGMIQSGEAAGKMTYVLANLADSTEKAYEIKAKVRSAMMYPMVIFALLIAVVVAMMVYVVPRIKDIFNSTQNELPLITRIVLGISDFFVNNGLIMLIVIAFMGIFFTLFRKTDVGRYQIDNLKIHIPIFGGLLKKAYLSRFARTISNLLESGVSIVRTFEITANSIGNDVYRKRLLLTMEDIKQGIPLADNLNEYKLFPPMLVSMIDVGEKTAQLGEITEKVANFYDQEVETAVNGLSKIIEPVILILVGLAVGTVVAAIMLPIMQLSDFATLL